MRELSDTIPFILDDVDCELRRATELYGPMNSSHEAYAIIAEELDEFWDLVRQKDVGTEEMRKELIQVAAMACRAVYDICAED